MVMPATLAITFSDGTTQDVKLPIEMWNLGDRFAYRVQGTTAVQRVVLDPKSAFPDVDRTNNVWPRR
jgi:hypothetical protein